MLKSLGQWNTLPVKQRKVIPTQLVNDRELRSEGTNDRGQGEESVARIEEVVIEE